MKTLLLSLVSLALLAGCGGGSGSGGAPGPERGPLLLRIAPGDHRRFDDIRGRADLSERERQQVLYLQEHGHDLAWFSEAGVDVSAQDTVQLLFFNYADYVVAFCSGTFLSDNFVATSGHCFRNSYALQGAGGRCDGHVIFAYKRSRDAALEYYRCDEVVSYGVEQREYVPAEGARRRYTMKDHALLRVRRSGGRPPVRPAVSAARAAVAEIGGHVAAVVVDPPTRADDLRSRYRLLTGRIGDNEALDTRHNLKRLDALYVDETSSGNVPGNSGGPVYLMAGAPGRTFSVADGAYLGPLTGGWVTHRELWNLPRPSTFLAEFLRLVLP